MCYHPLDKAAHDVLQPLCRLSFHDVFKLNSRIIGFYIHILVDRSQEIFFNAASTYNVQFIALAAGYISLKRFVRVSDSFRSTAVVGAAGAYAHRSMSPAP